MYNFTKFTGIIIYHMSWMRFMKHEHEVIYGLRAPTTLHSTLLLVVSNYTGCTINYSIDRKRNQHTGG